MDPAHHWSNNAAARLAARPDTLVRIVSSTHVQMRG